MLLLSVVLFLGRRFGRIVSAVASVVAFLAYNFFFLDPLLDLRRRALGRLRYAG